jgi:eukaryotic-like serine/threonine-protein kinase
MRTTTGKRARRKLIQIFAALMTALFCVVPMARAGHASAATLAAGASENWASFHQTSMLQGWAANSSVTTANAASLGVKWASDMYGPAVDSPVVAYDPKLTERIAYVGTQNGDVVAFDVATGQLVWSAYVGGQVRSSPLVAGGAVWLATANSTTVFKLNATTGATECSRALPWQIEGTPVAATPPGGVPSVYFGTLDTNTASGPLYAFAQSNCTVEWSFTGYRTPAGSWDPLTYAVDANGEPLVLFGTDDPDSTVYAVDAVTGALVWDYNTNPPPGDYDVGAGVVVSPPGTNGFAGGMAYAENKYGVMFGLNLTTGQKVWSVHYAKEVNSPRPNLSTAALSAHHLVLGDASGLVDLNPLNGHVTWSDADPAHAGVDSSAAIAGPANSQVVAVGDTAGGFEVDSLATGARLYHYQTGQYITASPAVSGADILIASADGFLYDFAVGGGNEHTLPTAAISSPAPSSQVADPDGDLIVTGSAADRTGIASVLVAVQASGPDGPWWDAAAGTWAPGPVPNPATLASPGSKSSSWTFAYPVPVSGGTYQVTAYTVSTTGQSSIVTAGSGFTVLPSASNPQVQTSAQYVAPGGQVTLSGTGFGAAENATISLAGTTLGTVQTTTSGAVPSTPVTIPATASFGLISLTVTGQASGETAAAGITIANQWCQLGYGNDHAGYEPDDTVLFNIVPVGFLNLAWAFGTGDPVSAPPAVADGVAYVPDNAGQLQAVAVRTGTPLWTWSDPSGAALGGAPAVDTSQGLAFVGGHDGTLTAVSTTGPDTGDTAWSDSLGGDVSAPVLDGHGDLYVTTSTGLLEAVSETTGAELWSVALASPASTAPTLDTAGNLLVVGESDGDVTALSLAGGATEWSYSTGSSPVITLPVIADGTVYTGAGDTVYALDEGTGTADWSYPTAGTVSSTLTVQSPYRKAIVVVGSADSVYGLAGATGAKLFQNRAGAPVTGVASAFERYIVTTSEGVIAGGRVVGRGKVWFSRTAAGAMTSPVIVDGTVYVGGQDSELYAYTPDGQPPA